MAELNQQGEEVREGDRPVRRVPYCIDQVRLICSLNLKLGTQPRTAVMAGVILSELRCRANMYMQDVEFEEGTSYRDS